MNTAWAIGFAVGVMIVAVFCTVMAKIAKNKGAFKGQYDERQQIARGRAFTVAYATLLLYLLLWMILRSIEIPFFMQPLSIVIGALLSLAVFVGHAIFHDAYFKASESPKHWLIIICAAGVMNLGIGVMHLVRDETLTDRLYENYNLFVGLLLVVTLALIVIKRAIDRRSEEE